MEKAESAETEEEQPGECQSLNQVVVKKISEICRVVNQVRNLKRALTELPVIRWLRSEGTSGSCLVRAQLRGPGEPVQLVESQLAGSHRKRDSVCP